MVENVGVGIGDLAGGAQELARGLVESRVDEKANLFRMRADEDALGARPRSRW